MVSTCMHFVKYTWIKLIDKSLMGKYNIYLFAVLVFMPVSIKIT